jgi:type II secretory pathway pseudopilin PulG
MDASVSTPRAPRRLRRKGLTLIELIVVLMILIALGGLLAPMLPSMLTRAHTSTCVTNIAETGRAIVTFQQLYSQYPNNWDALGDGTATINYLAGGAMMPAGVVSGSTTGTQGNGELQPLTPPLTAAEASALTAVGITTLQAMAATPGGTVGSGTFDPTFNYYTGITPTAGVVAVGTGTVLLGMDPTAAGAGSTTYAWCVAMNLPLTGRYVALGIGPRCSMIGKTVQNAPVHFGDTPVLNPEYGYQRLVAIFKVSDTAATAFTQAQLVGTAPVHDTGLGSIQDELQNWYQLTTGGS